MPPSNDSQRPRRTPWQLTAAAALGLLASVGWARPVSAAEPPSGDSAVSETVGGGPVTALAIDPDNPTTLYAGTSCSDVLKSLDGGDSWSAINIGLPDLYVTDLAINPATPTTLYAAALYARGTDVFKTLNGGSSWSALNTGFEAGAVLVLAINPRTPTTLYAGASASVFRSLNGGSGWSAVNTGLTDLYVRRLAIDPTTPATLYAGTLGGGVFRSVNGAVAGVRATPAC